MDDELGRFKREINLANYAASHGYRVNRKKSSQHCIAMDNVIGDRVVIGIDRKDSHYFYWSVRDSRDKGSIIDFVKHRNGLSLGEIRKELRPWIGERGTPPHAKTTASIPPPIPIEKDRAAIERERAQLGTVTIHPYLTQRGIARAVQQDERFRGTLLGDTYGNIVFPYRDKDGICGFERRNHQFKNFSRGGTKGLWSSRISRSDTALVICESPIDALSYHQLMRPTYTRYIATGGAISQFQEELLRGAASLIHKQNGRICIATDNDAAGNKLADQIIALLPSDALVERQVPKIGKDWNEMLHAVRDPHQKIENPPSLKPTHEKKCPTIRH
jgi:hypothetical protein